MLQRFPLYIIKFLQELPNCSHITQQRELEPQCLLNHHVGKEPAKEGAENRRGGVARPNLSRTALLFKYQLVA